MNISKDDFGNRMKSYEKVETSRKLDKTLPIYARIDGRCFSKFTKNMIRPFDWTMIRYMQDTTKYLVENTNAVIGYTQSDEISLLWKPHEDFSEMMFGAKIQKLCSVLAGMTTAKFSSIINEEERNKFPHFDCRVINLPSLEEAANMLLWRTIDAQKNSISMIAQTHFSHKLLQNKNQSDMINMLKNIKIYYDFYDDEKRFGSFFRRIKVKKELETGDIDRNVVSQIQIPQLKFIKNRVGFIFNNEEPIT